ncbi:MAG: VOC family protein [Methylobacter sp.]
MTAKPIPDGYHSITPYLMIKGASEAIEFYKQAFGAVEIFRLSHPNGQIGHAEIKIGDSSLMLADPCDQQGAFRTPHSLGGSSVALHVYVENVDAQFAQAIKAGAKEIKPVLNQFYGDRTGTLKDPYGHIWFLATRKEDIAPEEISRRAAALFQHIAA